MITKEEYIEFHNYLSWDIANACDAFSAMKVSLDWSSELVARFERGHTTSFSPCASSLMVISNSLVTYFFIAACKIREESRSKLNLSKLYADALKLNLLTKEQNAIAIELLASTEQTYKKLKIVRGMAVAHIGTTETPFAILKKNNLAQQDIRAYLEQCEELFQLLGEPINSNKGAIFEERDNHISQNMSLLYSAAWPFNAEKQPII
jgi:hypothetical protein